MELSNAFVCLMGLGTVFVGLISLILICYVVGFFSRERKAASVENSPAPGQTAVIENRGAVVAAVSAAVAEELGEDISAIRIVSLKKI